MKKITTLLLILVTTIANAQNNKEDIKSVNIVLTKQVEELTKENASLKSQISKDALKIIDLESELQKVISEKQNAEKIKYFNQIHDFTTSKKTTIFTTDFIKYESIPADLAYDYNQIETINLSNSLNGLRIDEVLDKIELISNLVNTVKEDKTFIKKLTEPQKAERYKIMNKSALFVLDYNNVKSFTEKFNLKNKAVIPELEALKKKFTYSIQIAYLNKIINEIKNQP